MHLQREGISMQALVLAGGRGTRLRPLTTTIPKPAMPLAGRPFITYMLDWLGRHGVDDVILSCGFLSNAVRAVLGDEHEGIALGYVTEDEPLGTAGPVALAMSQGMLDERVLVLNGDVLTDIDLTAQIESHEHSGAIATLALVAVGDTSSYGVVPTDGEGRVEAFLEKTGQPAAGCNRVNAGAYVLERTALERIPAGRPASFERELFPELVGHGLFGFAAEGYWMDIGTPERYLQATHDLLEGVVDSNIAVDGARSLVYGGCSIDGAEVGPLSVIGAHSHVAPGSVIHRSVLHRKVKIGHDCLVDRAVLADGVVVGDGSHVAAGALVGAGAIVAPGTLVPAGARIEAGAAVA